MPDAPHYTAASKKDLPFAITQDGPQDGPRDWTDHWPSSYSVMIPKGVTQIGKNAFYDCSGLTSVTIPEGVTQIGEYAFDGCSGLTSVRIPEGVTQIGEHAFDGCSGLTSVRIPDTVTHIGDDAFSHCGRLASVTISEGVTKIGERAFYGCRGLTSVRIPEGVTEIGNGAFARCSGLTSVTIRGKNTTVAATAFDYCDRLTVAMVAPHLVGRLCAQISFDSCPHFHDGILPVSAKAMSKVLTVRFWTPQSHRLCAEPRRLWARAILLIGARLQQLEGWPRLSILPPRIVLRLEPPPLPMELWFVVLGMLELHELGQAS